MELAELLEIGPGVTAVIGSGGKTSLLKALGRELIGRGRRVILCTTTKIYPFSDVENLLSPTWEALRAAMEVYGLVCTGTPVPGTGKLTAPDIPMDRLAELADCVLAEADGAAGRPLKAHASHEPVIPPEADRIICVMGASGFGRPVREVVHRPGRFGFLTGLGPEDSVTPEAAAKVLQIEASAARPPIRVFVNQVEDAAAMAAARRLAELLPWPVLAGSLMRKEFFRC